MFKVKLGSFARNAFDLSLYSRSVFGVSSFEYQVNRNLGCWLVFKYPKGLSTPVTFAPRGIPDETIGVAQFLSFCQVSFAPLEPVVTSSQPFA